MSCVLDIAGIERVRDLERSLTGVLSPTLFDGPEHQAFELPGVAPTVLALHGFMGTPAELRALARSLAALGAAVSAPLLPGFGTGVSQLAQVTARDWLMCALKRWQELRRCSSGEAILLGFSMGAAIALQLAVLAPPDRLVLLAPFTRLLPGDKRVPLLGVARRVLRDFRPFANANFEDPAIRKVFHAMHPALNLDDHSVRVALRELRLPLSALDELRKTGQRALAVARDVCCPVLVVQGSDDQTVPVWTTRQLVQRLGGRVTLFEVPGDHQLVRPDHPSAERTFRLVGQFVTGELA